MLLYSYKGQEPNILPDRIRLDNGDTRTSLNELSQRELESLGFIHVEKPIINEITQKIEWNGVNYVIVLLTEKPYPSWVLNENCEWESPVPSPTKTDNGKMYSWDEELLNWVEI